MSVLTDNTAKLRKILEKVENLPEIPESVAQATPTISVSSGGLITATATQEAGVVEAGTKTATKQMTTKGSSSIAPGTSQKTAVSAGTYVTGDVVVEAMPTATQATPSISVSSSGLITASATQAAGYVAEGTKSATRQLTTKGGTTITPSDAEQTAVSAGTYVTGDIKVAAAAGGARVVTGTVTVRDSWTDTITINLGFVPSVFSYGSSNDGGLYATRDGNSINRFYATSKTVAFEPTVTIQNGTITIELPMQRINNTYTSIYFYRGTHTWVAVE